VIYLYPGFPHGLILTTPKDWTVNLEELAICVRNVDGPDSSAVVGWLHRLSHNVTTDHDWFVILVEGFSRPIGPR